MSAATAVPPIPSSAKHEQILVARGLNKTFPGVKALENVDFDIRVSEVNALVGENGAGKSTLIKLISGFYAADSGEIIVDGRQMEATPAAAHRAGIATIHQDPHLVPNMSVAENIMLGHWPTRFGIIDRQAQAKRAVAAIAMVAPQLSPTTLARRLSPAEGQLVEIARAISERSRILIMDEPTTSLSMQEIDNLFAVVGELRQRGMGIVFVSHWLEEVFRIADRITVLRDARNVDSLPATELDAASVVKLMVGRDVQSVVAKPRPNGRVILKVENLGRTGVLDNVDLTVSAGEVVTLAGLVGAGRTELARCIFGIDRYDAGTVTLDGTGVKPGSPRAAIDAGIGLVPEDRRQEALVGGLSVSTNATLAALPAISPGGLLSERREELIRRLALQSVAIKMASQHVPISTLSGGNQQKVVIGRWLALKPKLLILDEPTKGIDIKSKAEISEIIIKLAEQGTAILLISSEMPEVLSLSDRVVVMRSGRAVGELRRGRITAEAVMHLATSG